MTRPRPLPAEARRRAVTQHARHVIVLYSFEDTTGAKEGTVERIRHALRVYCEPVGDPNWKTGYFKGGYVNEPIILPPGIRFAQDKMKFAQVFGPVTNASEPLPIDNDYFKKSQTSKAIGFRRDGTFDYDPSLDEPAVNPAGGGNIYQPDERFFQVPEACKADIVVVEVESSGKEIKVKGRPRRALIDLEPRTGRAMTKTFEIGASFDRE